MDCTAVMLKPVLWTQPHLLCMCLQGPILRQLEPFVVPVPNLKPLERGLGHWKPLMALRNINIGSMTVGNEPEDLAGCR